MLKNAQKSLLFTLFWPFLAKKFVSKIRLHCALDTIKSYLDTKNPKKI